MAPGMKAGAEVVAQRPAGAGHEVRSRVTADATRPATGSASDSQSPERASQAPAHAGDAPSPAVDITLASQPSTHADDSLTAPIGVLAVQGAFAEHCRMLGGLGARTVLLRDAAACRQPLAGLVLPGGESTVQGKLLAELGMLAPLRALIEGGLPVLGTCAGAILLADHVQGGQPCLATMPLTVQRNAYGRQLASFHAQAALAGAGDRPVPMTFIRAPKITQVREGAQALATVDGAIVAAACGNQLALTFHPELDDCTYIHAMFLARCRAFQAESLLR